MSQPPTRAFYLRHDSEPVYALFDDSEGTVRQTSVLLCPLFGNDDICSYRARREWAKALAAAGHPTLRFDLPGTGDSVGGPYDPERLQAWTDAVAAAAVWLGEEAARTRVVAIGIGFGGLLAYRALASGASIDDLVLWSVPARGRTFVRQLRALSQMEASSETHLDERDAVESAPMVDTSAPRLEPGALASAGFVMSAETLEALEALDLTRLDLPNPSSRRVLMLERDGLEVDPRLRTTLEESGVDLTISPGPGYGAMVAPPQQSRPPVGVFASVERWLAAGPAETPTLASAASSASIAAPLGTTAAAKTIVADAVELHHDGAHIRELPIAVRYSDGQLTGVLAQPDGPAQICAVLLNAGALRHIGPNRMWVETARRWAARGVPTLRIDLAGIGDADGDAEVLEKDESFYDPRFVEQTHEVLAALTARGLPERFVLCGLCSGAYWALHAALADERVCGAFLINPRALFWDWSLEGVREARNARKVLRLETWRKLARGQIERERIGTVARGVGVALATLPSRMRAYRRSRHSDHDPLALALDPLALALDQLDSAGTELLGVFTAREPVFEELERDGGLERARSHANVRLDSIPGPLTSHTLEPLELQSTVNGLLDDALTRVLTGQP